MYFLIPTAGYKINGTTVIRGTALNTITSAPDMQTLGVLTELNVDNVNIDPKKLVLQLVTYS